MQRAAIVAKWCTAIHAARALRFGLFIVKPNRELVIMLQPFCNSLVPFFYPGELHEASNLTHG
jgi:hypothetical protein